MSYNNINTSSMRYIRKNYTQRNVLHDVYNIMCNSIEMYKLFSSHFTKQTSKVPQYH